MRRDGRQAEGDGKCGGRENEGGRERMSARELVREGGNVKRGVKERAEWWQRERRGLERVLEEDERELREMSQCNAIPQILVNADWALVDQQQPDLRMPS